MTLRSFRLALLALIVSMLAACHPSMHLGSYEAPPGLTAEGGATIADRKIPGKDLFTHYVFVSAVDGTPVAWSEATSDRSILIAPGPHRVTLTWSHLNDSATTIVSFTAKPGAHVAVTGWVVEPGVSVQLWLEDPETGRGLTDRPVALVPGRGYGATIEPPYR
jgi:hypothetical protein